MTKGHKKAQDRRRIRRTEKHSLVIQDKMAGRACRRAWGRGKSADPHFRGGDLRLLEKAY